MAKEGFKEATGRNEDIVSMIEAGGTVYVATDSFIYRLVSRNRKYVVTELLFEVDEAEIQ